MDDIREQLLSEIMRTDHYSFSKECYHSYEYISKTISCSTPFLEFYLVNIGVACETNYVKD